MTYNILKEQNNLSNCFRVKYLALELLGSYVNPLPEEICSPEFWILILNSLKKDFAFSPLNFMNIFNINN